MVKKKVSFFRKNLRGILVGVIIGGVIFGSIGVYAATYFPSNDVTYNNETSGLESTDVQGAIDELYNVCKNPPIGGESILDSVDIVTSGDGLYKDENEDRYFYRGANPNNYITFNNEQAGWRILSIESDNTIKIVRSASIGNMAWDSSGSWGSNNWARPADLNTYLNGNYYSGLNSTAKGQIVASNFSIGAVTDDNNDLVGQINNENSNKWYGNVGLPTVSEYIRTNSNKAQCGTMQKTTDNTSACQKTNWMLSNEGWWTLSPYHDHTYFVFLVTSGITFNRLNANRYDVGVRPVLYLNPNIQFIGGDGTQNNPYRVNID